MPREHSVSSTAAFALAHINDRRTNETLVELLIKTLENDHRNVAYGAQEKLVLLGASAVEPMMFVLRHGKPQARLRAAWGLTELHDRRSVEALIEAVTDEDEFEDVRRAAARALGAIEDPRAVTPLLGVLSDPNPLVRSAAAKALGEISDPRMAAPLAALLVHERDKSVRQWAMFAIGRLPPVVVAPELAKVIP